MLQRPCYLTTLLIVISLFFCACREHIDTSARYTFTTHTAVSYLEAHADQYSYYLDALQRVPVSRVSKSSLYQLLTARGNYTIFAPTNEAIEKYLARLVEEGTIACADWQGMLQEARADSILQVITKNSIIDNKDNAAYQTTDFPVQENGEFALSNMKDMKLTTRVGSDPDSIFINRNCLMSLRNRDIQVINGFIHAMEDVIAPSEVTLGQMIGRIVEDQKPGFLVMSRLLMACGFKDELNKYRDEVYEEKYLRGEIEDFNAKAIGWTFHGATGHSTAYAPEHRKYGFTIFAETDEFWESALGKAAADITPGDVQQWVLDNKAYAQEDQFTTDAPFTSPQSLLYQWVTYHMLPMRIPANKLVLHVNEKGYNFKTSISYTIPVMEFYTTMGQRRLIKIFESRESKGIYLNRFPRLDNGRKGTGRERGCDPDKVGCRIRTEGEVVLETEAVNGIIYAIDRPLSYDDATRNNLMMQRIRFDGMSLFPEAMTNDIRKKESLDYHDQYVFIPTDQVYRYFDNMWMNENTHFIYLNSYGYDWCNLQQDEMKACGQYDITVKLPPVPRTSTYELRYRVLPQPERGVIQFYFGSDRESLRPTGIPIDLRIYGNNSSVTGWQLDTDDEDYNAEVDKLMRSNNRLKGEESIANNSGTARSSGNSHIYRYILTRQRLEPDKTYYLRMKSVLESNVTEFYMDALEFCAKEVYDNPAVPEDIW